MNFIAELCQNHNGDIETLKEMVACAADAGAKYCKIQTFFAKDCNWPEDVDRLKGLELNWAAHETFVNACHKNDVTPMTSVYSFDYAEQLGRLGFRHVKIGSAQFKREDLIKRYIAAGFKVHISTGGNDLSKVKPFGPLASVMHCVSRYPTPVNAANISRMLELKRIWPKTAIGFSDHTSGTDAKWDVPTKLAIYLGADVIEKHFTILRRNQTKDGPVSITKKQLKELIDFSRLPKVEQLKQYSWFGLFKAPQLESEIKTIERYEDRWKNIR